MDNMTIIMSYKNCVVLSDDFTGYYWLYSYNKPIACYHNGKFDVSKNKLSEMSKKHLQSFKQIIFDLF